ncbi:hypothetical protein DUNSADRAFT_18634 [Dunaliella salina]|uniref:Uncharacterized protein n=1 Tax=Dunaliella salina TaxID=3046 RepID=A0ABQ7GYR7_DUNSA|nr:hypothetical protein DUNSADRAFT_18634 [Dunaliella salina]|eukprot:KAF5839756.1 hypothetical protein DUNSADRAFT_18634 [Dunaliella salina]
MLFQTLQSGVRPLQTSPLLPSSRLSAHCSSLNSTISNRRLFLARTQQHSPSHTCSVLCHAKRNTSSSKECCNDDKELARQAMRQMEALGGSSPQQPSRKQGRDARVAGMDADWLATKARKQPTLAEALDAIEAAVSPSAAATARMLYDLGTALNKGKARIQEGRVASAMAKLTALMLEEHKESGSSSNAPRIQQLQGGREFNLSAWALSKVQTIRDTDVTQLGLAFTEQALHGPVMNGEGWRGWSALLFGLAKAGMSCQSNLQEAYMLLRLQQALNKDYKVVR